MDKIELEIDIINRLQDKGFIKNIHAIEQFDFLFEQAGENPLTLTELSLLCNGEQIQAIKSIRSRLHLGLAATKWITNAIIRMLNSQNRIIKRWETS